MNLRQYGRKVYSQFWEDGITLELVRRLDPPRVFVEIGAGHNGENCTRILLDEGWNGLWLDMKADMLQKAVKHPNVEIRHAFVTSDNIRYHLRGIPEDIGVLSIDVDGNDYHIWKTVCGEPILRPALCIIECNVQKPMDAQYVMPYDPHHVWDHASHEHGASVYSMIELGKELGYTFVGMASDTPQLDSPNAFFVRDDRTSEVC